ncbi:hypothetical protein C0J52_05263 [Blattella germanica]|nr:hypothetical protein C0J52_05263 [Blattella germanica]
MSYTHQLNRLTIEGGLGGHWPFRRPQDDDSPGCVTGLCRALVNVPRSCKAMRRCNTQQFGPQPRPMKLQKRCHNMGISLAARSRAEKGS